MATQGISADDSEAMTENILLEATCGTMVSRSARNMDGCIHIPFLLVTLDGKLLAALEKRCGPAAK